MADTSKLGSSECITTTHVSPTELVCAVAAGTGAALSVSATDSTSATGVEILCASGYISYTCPIGTLTGSFSYNAPAVSGSTTALSSGGPVTVQGSDLGNSNDNLLIYIGASVCANATVVSPHTSIRCTAQSGCGVGLSVTVCATTFVIWCSDPTHPGTSDKCIWYRSGNI